MVVSERCVAVLSPTSGFRTVIARGNRGPGHRKMGRPMVQPDAVSGVVCSHRGQPSGGREPAVRTDPGR